MEACQDVSKAKQTPSSLSCVGWQLSEALWLVVCPNSIASLCLTVISVFTVSSPQPQIPFPLPCPSCII